MKDDKSFNTDLWTLLIKNIKPLSKSDNKFLPEPPARSPIENINIINKRLEFDLQEPQKFVVNSYSNSQHVMQELTLHEIKKRKIQSRIDLHGYTRNQAESALSRFFMGAQSSNLNFVLIITGKGDVLKNLAPDWLKKHPEYVVSFKQALPKDGGSGAFYVHVRRLRKKK